MLDKDKIKESLTVNDITLILKDLGSATPRQDNSGNPIYQTVCHNVFNGKYKLYYYKESNIFHCYSSCSDNFDVYELVIRAKRIRGQKLEFYDAVKYVAHITGKEFTKNENFVVSNNIINDWEWLDRFKKKEKVNIDLPIFSKHVLEVFVNLPNAWWRREGITHEVMKKYNIGYYVKQDKITIPHFDIDNNLIGIRGRAMLQEDIDAGKKYMPLIVGDTMYNYPTAFALYGLNHTKNAIKRIKKIILFEGEKSVLLCESFYGEDNFAVAVQGSNITPFQRDMILELGVEEVIIAFDKEYEDPKSEEALKYAQKILERARQFTPFVRTYVLWDTEGLLDYKDSPIDKGQEVLETLMKNKKIVLMKEE